jgi:16S rRNA (guanine(527)-N(7))-methyltransferase RsmG
MDNLLLELVNNNFSNVSRETIDKFSLYLDLLSHWNKEFNLVSRNTNENDLIVRHLLDSLQLKNYILNPNAKIVDLGSGAGFPGLVLAILGYQCILLEINEKKAAFLQEVCFQLKLKTKVVNKNFNTLSGFEAQYITSRAVSSLKDLFSSCSQIITPKTTCLILKSKKQLAEIDDITKFWSFKLQLHENLFNNEGVIIEISELNLWEK